jgi:hypothetical protein
MKLASCFSCGVVVDMDRVLMEKQEIFNHDGDMKSTAVTCPVCKELIEDEAGWERV